MRCSTNVSSLLHSPDLHLKSRRLILFYLSTCMKASLSVPKRLEQLFHLEQTALSHFGRAAPLGIETRFSFWLFQLQTVPSLPICANQICGRQREDAVKDTAVGGAGR